LSQLAEKIAIKRATTFFRIKSNRAYLFFNAADVTGINDYSGIKSLVIAD